MEKYRSYSKKSDGDFIQTHEKSPSTKKPRGLIDQSIPDSVEVKMYKIQRSIDWMAKELWEDIVTNIEHQKAEIISESQRIESESHFIVQDAQEQFQLLSSQVNQATMELDDLSFKIKENRYSIETAEKDKALLQAQVDKVVSDNKLLENQLSLEIDKVKKSEDFLNITEDLIERTKSHEEKTREYLTLSEDKITLLNDKIQKNREKIEVINSKQELFSTKCDDLKVNLQANRIDQDVKDIEMHNRLLGLRKS